MSEQGTELYLLVTSTGSDALVDAVREVRDEAVRRGAAVEVEVLVESADRAASVREVVADLNIPSSVSVTTTVTPDRARALHERVATGGVSCVLVDPASGVDVGAVTDTAVRVERLSTGREIRRRRLVHDRDLAGFVLTFVLSFGFYLLLGDPTDPFDLVTGVATAGVVAASLSAIVVETESSVSGVLVRSLRATAFLPYLLYEIVKANLGVAYVILHPDLPINPRMVTYDAETDGRFERAVLANAITLTPGTLTVDVDGRQLRVHTLTPGTRGGLEEGSLRRAVAWVFHGRRTR
jgi:multisubunit Na+/H+ antiporter MnhE subunit/soluble P-type ATPase